MRDRSSSTTTISIACVGSRFCVSYRVSIPESKVIGGKAIDYKPELYFLESRILTSLAAASHPMSQITD